MIKFFTEVGCRSNCKRGNNLRYEDDTTIFANKPQELLERLLTIIEHYGLEINSDNSKVMTIRKQSKHETSNIYIKGKKVEQVKTYTYLGTVINEQWDHSQEMKCRIEKARNSTK